MVTNLVTAAPLVFVYCRDKTKDRYFDRDRERDYERDRDYRRERDRGRRRDYDRDKRRSRSRSRSKSRERPFRVTDLRLKIDKTKLREIAM